MTASTLLLVARIHPHECRAIFFGNKPQASNPTAMSAGFFNLGRKWLFDKGLRNQLAGTTLSLGLYSNARDTITHRNVLADIVAVSGTGYAPIAIAAADWSVTVVTAADPLDDVVQLTIPLQTFTAPDVWSTVRGAYVYDPVNSVAIAWRDAPADLPMPSAAKALVDWLSEVSAG